jgi:hypothetical protein
LNLLRRLDKGQLKQILEIVDEVPVSKYLQNTINELRDGAQAKSRIQEVLDVVEVHEKELKKEIESTPSSDKKASRGFNGLSDFFQECFKADRGK